MSIERVIDKIKVQQQKVAVDALKKPKGQTAFDYGQASGLYHGMEMALQIIFNDLNEEKNGKDDL